MLNKAVFRNAKSEDSYLQEAGGCFYLFKQYIQIVSYLVIFLENTTACNAAFLEKKIQ